MADTASMPGSTLTAADHHALTGAARWFVRLVLAALTSFDDGTAGRNAWESACADLQRRPVDVSTGVHGGWTRGRGACRMCNFSSEGK